jgi:hypothetical protein
MKLRAIGTLLAAYAFQFGSMSATQAPTPYSDSMQEHHPCEREEKDSFSKNMRSGGCRPATENRIHCDNREANIRKLHQKRDVAGGRSF